MRAADFAKQAFQGINETEAFETVRETGVRPEALPPATAYETRATQADHDLAALLGVDGSRQEFLGARTLVDPSWSVDDALRAASEWWQRDLDDISAIQWVMSAAHADVVKQFSTHQYEQTDGSKRGQNGSLKGGNYGGRCF